MPKGETSRPSTRLEKTATGKGLAKMGENIRKEGAGIEKGLGKKYEPYRITTPTKK